MTTADAVLSIAGMLAGAALAYAAQTLHAGLKLRTARLDALETAQSGLDAKMADLQTSQIKLGEVSNQHTVGLQKHDQALSRIGLKLGLKIDGTEPATREKNHD